MRLCYAPSPPGSPISTPSAIDALAQAIRQARAETAAATATDRRATINHDLAAVTARIGNLVDSIAVAGPIPELVARLTAEKAYQATLVAERDRLTATPTSLHQKAALCALVNHAARWRRALGRTVPGTRQLLRALLGETKIGMMPIGRRAYRFMGRMRLGNALLIGAAGKTRHIVVAPTRYVGWWENP